MILMKEVISKCRVGTDKQNRGSTKDMETLNAQHRKELDLIKETNQKYRRLKTLLNVYAAKSTSVKVEYQI